MACPEKSVDFFLDFLILEGWTDRLSETSVAFFLDFLTLEDGTDSLSRNVGGFLLGLPDT
jgi:hypothetical protein